MDLLRSVVQSLAAGAIVLVLLQTYLTANKLWKRKHERVVAESISISGEVIGLIPLVLLTVHFALQGQWEGTLDGIIGMASAAIAIVVGAGLWVEGQRGLGFWYLIRRSLRLERGEVGDLARSLFRPAAAQRVIRILSRIAMIDEHLDERERRFIRSFATAWGIPFSPATMGALTASGAHSFLELRRDVAGYLATSPPVSQVKHLADIISTLVKIDQNISEEERILLGELEGMWNGYLVRDVAAPRYGVALVPQRPAQEEAIISVLPRAEKTRVHGGDVYLVGLYYSEEYAEIVSEQYRELDVFTTVVRDGPPRGEGGKDPERDGAAPLVAS